VHFLLDYAHVWRNTKYQPPAPHLPSTPLLPSLPPITTHFPPPSHLLHTQGMHRPNMKRTTSQRHTVKASKAQWGTVGLSLMLAKTSMLQKMGKVEATVSFYFKYTNRLISLLFDDMHLVYSFTLHTVCVSSLWFDHLSYMFYVHLWLRRDSKFDRCLCILEKPIISAFVCWNCRFHTILSSYFKNAYKPD
jgi:hypothetical protein